jgi:hypothetical protein
MSIWHEPSPEDIEIGEDELLIRVFADDFGNHWVAVELDIIRKLLKEYDEKEKI